MRAGMSRGLIWRRSCARSWQLPDFLATEQEMIFQEVHRLPAMRMQARISPDSREHSRQNLRKSRKLRIPVLRIRRDPARVQAEKEISQLIRAKRNRTQAKMIRVWNLPRRPVPRLPAILRTTWRS